MLRRLIPFAVTALLALALVGRARADQSQPDYDAASKHYLAAEDARAKGDTAIAVREYLAAYDITKDPSLLKAVAGAYEDGGKKEEAVSYYKRYLSSATNLSADEQKQVQAKIDELQGVKPGEGTEVMGPGETGGTQTGGTTGTETGGTAGTETGGTAGTETGGTAGGTSDLGAPPTFMSTQTRWTRTAAWVSVGVAAVALATGGVLGMSANSREQDINRLIDFRDPQTGQPKAFTGNVKADYNAKNSEGKDLSNAATIAFIAAGGAAIVATVFFIVDAHSAKAERTASVLRHVTPYVDASTGGGAGLVAGWEF